MTASLPAYDPERAAARAAKILLETRSVLFNAEQPFTFTSGRISPVYIDCRRLISFPAERAALMDDAAALLHEKCPGAHYIAGGETAGIPYAAFVADRLRLPMLYVRKQAKGFGRMAQIEGCMEDEGANVILVEDLQTDGGSKKLFIDALRKAGAEVTDSFVVFHYGIFPASEKNMEALGVRLHSLTNWWAVLEAAKQGNAFDTRTLAAVEAFLHAPEEWAPAAQAPVKN
jgi:orotate phosphoribosyltransferase